MKEHQPTNSNLLNLGVELLERGKINGIKCYIDLTENRIKAIMQRNNNDLTIGIYLPYPSDNTAQNQQWLEEKLAEEIKVHFLLDDIFAKAEKIAKNKYTLLEV